MQRNLGQTLLLRLHLAYIWNQLSDIASARTAVADGHNHFLLSLVCSTPRDTLLRGTSGRRLGCRLDHSAHFLLLSASAFGPIVSYS